MRVALPGSDDALGRRGSAVLHLERAARRAERPDAFVEKLREKLIAVTQSGRWDDANAERTVRMLHDASAEMERLKRADLYRQASRIIQRAVPAVPIVHADVPVAVSRIVSGYVPHPKGSEVFTFVQLGPKPHLVVRLGWTCQPSGRVKWLARGVAPRASTPHRSLAWLGMPATQSSNTVG